MKILLLAVASGVLFAFSLPPYNVEFLGWVALAPLLAGVGRISRPLWAMGAGLLGGVVCGAVLVGFRGGGTAMNYAYMPFLWLGLALGLVGAFACWSRRRFPDGGLRWVLLVACAGVAVEWLTTGTPLPVGIAPCQHRNVPLLQLAASTGIWGVSFLLWGVNAALADAVLRRRALTVPVVLFPALVGLCVALGAAYLFPATTWAGRPRLRVAAIQDYTGQESASDPYAPPPTEGDVPDAVALMRQAADRGAQIIVGTENGFRSAFRPDAPEDEVNALAREKNVHLVVGHETRAEPKPFNCATLVGPDGKPVGTHRKIKLFLGERQMMQAGDRAASYPTRWGRVGVVICFDSCFPLVFREAARGAVLVAMPNYDPPTPRAALHNLHVALLPFRAVENGVAFVRADPNGQSLLIDPWGRVTAMSPMYRAEALVGDVPLGDGRPTLYGRLGDWFVYLCLAALAPLLFAPNAGSRRWSASPGATVAGPSAGPARPSRTPQPE